MLSVETAPDPGGLLGATWAQGGALLVLVAVLLWYVWTGIQRDRRRLDEQDVWIRTEAIPALTKSTAALTRAADLLASTGSHGS